MGRFWQSWDLFCSWEDNFRFPPHIVFPLRTIFQLFSGRSSGELFTHNRKFLVKVLKYLSEQRYPLTSPYTMTKRTTYYSNTTGGPATLTAGRDHKGHLPTNFRLQKARNRPNDCPDEIKRQKTKDRMSMLRPLFLSEATRSTHTPTATLAKLVGVKASALRRYRSQVLRGGNFEKNLSFHLRTCVRTILTLDQA